MDGSRAAGYALCHLTDMAGQFGYNQITVSTEQRPQEFQFDLSGGHLALDFANSVSRRDSPEKTVEHIAGYRDLISFALQSKLLAPEEAAAMEREASSQQRSASQALRKGLELREAMFRSFIRLAANKSAPPDDLALIEHAATDALSHRRIVRTNGGYRWEWDRDPKLEKILWAIAASAADLVVSDDLRKLRECEASDCYWLFLDNSRNRSRRWCAMNSCGNREKARRHYRRRHHE
jgi:predicted RNA-binding Zn ribbon-like protein